MAGIGSEYTHTCLWWTQRSYATDLACLYVLQWPCSASSLLLEKAAHCVLQLLIVLEQKAELPASVHCADGKLWSLIFTLTDALAIIALIQPSIGQLTGQGLHHVLQHASQVVQLRSEGRELRLDGYMAASYWDFIKNFIHVDMMALTQTSLGLAGCRFCTGRGFFSRFQTRFTKAMLHHMYESKSNSSSSLDLQVKTYGSCHLQAIHVKCCNAFCTFTTC